MNRGILTVNGREYNLNPYMTLYMEMCTAGAIWGAAIGGTLGFTVVAVTPMILGGVGLGILGQTVANALSSRK